MEVKYSTKAICGRVGLGLCVTVAAAEEALLLKPYVHGFACTAHLACSPCLFVFLFFFFFNLIPNILISFNFIGDRRVWVENESNVPL